MRVAGVREFRNRAPELVKSDDIVLITRHGKLSGILVPLSSPEELPVDLRKEMLSRIGPAISGHLKKRGVSEQKVLRDFASWKSRGRPGRRRR